MTRVALRESRPNMPQSPNEAGAVFTRSWVCGTCGFRAHGPTQPDNCPECGGDRHDFRRIGH